MAQEIVVWRTRTGKTKYDAHDYKQPEHLLENRTIGPRTNPRRIKPRQRKQNQDRAKHGDNATQLVRNGAKDCVERQIIPFRNNMRRRRQRISWQVVHGMAQIVWRKEHEGREEDHEHGNRECILHCVVRVERNRIL